MSIQSLTKEQKEKVFGLLADAYNPAISSYALTNDLYQLVIKLFGREKVIRLFNCYGVEPKSFDLNCLRVIIVGVISSLTEQEFNSFNEFFLKAAGITEHELSSYDIHIKFRTLLLLTKTNIADLLDGIINKQLQVISDKYVSNTAKKVTPRKAFHVSHNSDMRDENFDLNSLSPILNFDLSKEHISENARLEIEKNNIRKERKALTKLNIKYIIKHIEQLNNICNCYDYDISQYASQTFKRNALAEHCAHSLAYSDFENKQIVPMFNLRGEMEIYQINVIKAYPGLFCYALTPLVYCLLPEEMFTIKIIFRGTDTYNLLSSLQKDFEYDSPGYITFLSEEYSILRKIAAVVKECKRTNKVDKVGLWVSGHSLGGSLAQYCGAALMRVKVVKSAIANLGEVKYNVGYFKYKNIFSQVAKDYDSTLRKGLVGHNDQREIIKLTVKKLKRDLLPFSSLPLEYDDLTISTFNTAGIPKKISKRSIGYAVLLSKHNFVVKHDDVKVNGDTLQRTGSCHILYDIKKEYAKVTCTYFDLGENTSSYTLHTGYLYKGEKIPTHVVIPNADPVRKILARELRKKYLYTQMLSLLVFRPIVSFLHSIFSIYESFVARKAKEYFGVEVQQAILKKSNSFDRRYIEATNIKDIRAALESEDGDIDEYRPTIFRKEA